MLIAIGIDSAKHFILKDQSMRKYLIVPTGLLAVLVLAAAFWYSRPLDPKSAVQKALNEAVADQVPVLLIFGAEWCGDCRALDQAITHGKNAELLARNFKVVKIDVGEFDRNLDLAEAYGNPIENGIPAAVVLSPTNDVLYSTRAGELANARSMSESGIHDFFQGVLAQTASMNLKLDNHSKNSPHQ